MKDKKKERPVLAEYGDEGINTDPFGSYTGTPNDPYEKPVQDADDL